MNTGPLFSVGLILLLNAIFDLGIYGNILGGLGSAFLGFAIEEWIEEMRGLERASASDSSDRVESVGVSAKTTPMSVPRANPLGVSE